MSTDAVQDLLSAAQRDNTRRSYEAAVRHFEIEGGGFLPASASAVAQYLATFASTHAINTLLQRLAAISRWHLDHGFDDPTKDPIVRQVVRGIRATYPARERQAKPLAIEQLQVIDESLVNRIEKAKINGDVATAIRLVRDRSLTLVGFWRGFRSDELVSMRVEDIEIDPGVGMTCFLGSSKTDRLNVGRLHQCPALTKMCPVTAMSDWLVVSKITTGPVYRRIDRWGKLSDEGLHPSSVIPMLRRIMHDGGVVSPGGYTSHSLRRGFANWARDSGWDLKDLMSYVGWRDVKSAMRYLESSNQTLREKFEKGLAQSAAAGGGGRAA